jgi:hypothetical protein
MVKPRFGGKKAQLRRELLHAAETMVQAGVSRTTRTCSSPGCGCHTDPSRRHGPHTYLTFRDTAGKSRSLYVAPDHVAEALEAKAAWDRFWAAAVALAAANREALRRRWQGTPTPRTPR